jgi:hypothetical protein
MGSADVQAAAFIDFLLLEYFRCTFLGNLSAFVDSTGTA